MTEERQATTVRLTRRQLRWLNDQSFERRCTRQDIIEQALGAVGAPVVAPVSSLLRCPVCAGEAWYVAQLDRYVHSDGSDNATCWATLLRRRA